MTQVKYTGPISPFGNLTQGAGLSAAFDGNVNKAQAASARGINHTTTPNKIGIDLGAGQGLVWTGFRLTCPNNSKLFEHDATGTSRTVELRDDITGTLIGSATAAEAFSRGWENMTISNGVSYQKPYCTVAGSAPVNDGMEVSQVELYYEDSGGSSPPPPPPPPPNPGQPRALFLLWGQSHMVGWAPIQDQSAYRNRSRIKTFQNGQWIDGADPLSITSGPFEFGWMGCGMPFADEMAALLPDYEIAPLVRAHGSTSINSWVPGSQLLTAAIADWQAALASAPAGSFIAGMASWQGESDNGSPSGWGTKRLSITAAIRSAFNLPDLPDVIICCDNRWTGILAEQLGMGLPKNISRVRIEDFVPPSAGDLKDPMQYRIAGRRLAWSMRGMVLK